MTDIGGIASERLTVLLPFPPSVNNLFVNGKKGRFPSARYTTWRRAAENQIKGQQESWTTKSISGPVEVVMTFGRPDRRRRDLDNLGKAPLDTLVNAGIIDDDSAIQSLTMRWGDVDGSHVEISAI